MYRKKDEITYRELRYEKEMLTINRIFWESKRGYQFIARLKAIKYYKGFFYY